MSDGSVLRAMRKLTLRCAGLFVASELNISSHLQTLNSELSQVSAPGAQELKKGAGAGVSVSVSSDAAKTKISKEGMTPPVKEMKTMGIANSESFPSHISCHLVSPRPIGAGSEKDARRDERSGKSVAATYAEPLLPGEQYARTQRLASVLDQGQADAHSLDRPRARGGSSRRGGGGGRGEDAVDFVARAFEDVPESEAAAAAAAAATAAGATNESVASSKTGKMYRRAIKSRSKGR